MKTDRKMFCYCITKLNEESQEFSLDDGVVSCPFCHALNNVCIVFQSDDYVYKINMVWCDTCGTRCAVPSDAAEDKNS
jgi:transcription elongation factor Elf1